MKIGIMQPYFIPYIGYWQLMNAVDEYVVFDDVNYIKRGWINRNRILINGQASFFTLSLSHASQNKHICDTNLFYTSEDCEKKLETIQKAYGKAPYFDEVYPLVERIIKYKEENLVKYLMHSFEVLMPYMGITTKLILASEIETPLELRGQDRIIYICKKLGATEYYNAIGGQELYQKEKFENENMKLKFLQTDKIEYLQFKNEFQENLSIIDVLMFNSKDEVKKMLNKYQLI